MQPGLETTKSTQPGTAPDRRVVDVALFIINKNLPFRARLIGFRQVLYPSRVIAKRPIPYNIVNSQNSHDPAPTAAADETELGFASVEFL